MMTDPVQFAEKGLRHKTWKTQKAILRAVAKHPRVAVKSCHASSKTFAASEIALWWVTRWPDAKVLIVAPGMRQVRSVVWAEIHRAIRTSRFPFPAMATLTELKLSDENFILGFTS